MAIVQECLDDGKGYREGLGSKARSSRPSGQKSKLAIVVLHHRFLVIVVVVVVVGVGVGTIGFCWVLLVADVDRRPITIGGGGRGGGGG